MPSEGALIPAAASPERPRGSRVGVDAVDRVVLMDDHDGAYGAWRDAGVADRILVHVDAHHDLAFRGVHDPLSIGNFICPAIADGIVREVYWVVPDPSWASATDRRTIAQQIRRLLAQYPEPAAPLRVDADAMRTTVMGVPVTVGPLANLPALDACVLLDLDTDYLVVARVYHESDAHRSLPWCWPGDLVARLASAGVRTDLVTVARSVRGGYTPLRWSYLADELAARCSGAPPEALEGFEALKRAALAAARGDAEAEDAALADAQRCLPCSAAPAYHRARRDAGAGRLDLAREHLRQAVAIDPSYKTPFGNSGLAYYRERRFQEAECEVRRAIALDDTDAVAHFGLGRILALDRKWDEAQRALERAVSLDDTIVEAHRALGYVLARRGRLDEAIAAYDHSLMLALLGYTRLDGFIGSERPSRAIDADHCRIHGEVARLQARKGDRRRAIASFRMCVAGPDARSVEYARLGMAQFAAGDRAAAARAFAHGVARVPRDLARLMRRAALYGRAIVRHGGRLPVVVPADLA
jgi:tetratricopeptide (TPR) repeat protein